MLDLLRGSQSEFESALQEKDAEIATLQAQIEAYQEADQRDFLADNSDQLASIISTKNQVIQDLQLQLQQLTQLTSSDPSASSAPSAASAAGGTLAQALESARTSAVEVERLRRKLKEQQHQLQLYREENHRQVRCIQNLWKETDSSCWWSSKIHWDVLLFGFSSVRNGSSNTAFGFFWGWSAMI